MHTIPLQSLYCHSKVTSHYGSPKKIVPNTFLEYQIQVQFDTFLQIKCTFLKNWTSFCYFLEKCNNLVYGLCLVSECEYFCGCSGTHRGGIVNLEQSCMDLLVRFRSLLSGCYDSRTFVCTYSKHFHSRVISEQSISYLLFSLIKIGYCWYKYNFYIHFIQPDFIT